MSQLLHPVQSNRADGLLEGKFTQKPHCLCIVKRSICARVLRAAYILLGGLFDQ